MPSYNAPRDHRLSAMLGRLAQARHTVVAPLTITAWHTKEPVPYAERQSGKRLDLKVGDPWGELFDCAWMHFTGAIPPAAAGAEVVALIDVCGEALVVDAHGLPRLGLTNKDSGYDYSLGSPGKCVVPLARPAKGGEAVELWADSGANDLFGVLRDEGRLRDASIAIAHPHIRALWYDWEVLHELMGQLPEHCARRQRIWAALLAASQILTDITDETAAQARDILAPELAKRGGDPSLTVSAIGHSHIDLAWLWPVRETIRKGARTFATALRHMETYPDYHFGQSQPQVYQWMKEHYPSVYAEIKARVAEGRWEVQGGMWVEADANVPSGESFVRQLLYGKRFYRDEFGIDVKGLWLPDVFGYSAALPQLLRGAGCDWFMTQKLSWSKVNVFPHQTFRWTGLDGSTVLAHMLPEETYNAPASPRGILKAEHNYKDKTVSTDCLMLYGIGDGGGGPGEEHLERLAREHHLDGLPPVVQEPSQRFFERLAAGYDSFPEWVGELYLEFHQGTYTTQARNKRFNRKMEFALREAELSAARARWEGGTAYPREALLTIWREMLLYQFHDILPGSSITRVYDESRARYAVLMAETEALRDAADAAAGTEKVVVNSLGWERREWLQVDGAWRHVTVPALAAVAWPATVDVEGTLIATSEGLENEHLRVTLAADGSLTSLFDKDHGREVLSGPGNRLAVYRDPGDAWDFHMDYTDQTPEHFRLIGIDARLDGPRALVRQTYAYGASKLTQELVLMAGSRRLDFVTHVDWRESGRMLRTSFPATVRAVEATCEIQFGHLRRPTHTNTTWDLAKFEICAHKWIDLSDRGYGLAVLNDCKYGHRAHGSTLDINLLRSPGHPDPVADRAEHDLTYSLYPHAGDVAEGGVVRAGYELNVPLRVATGAPHETLLSVDAPNVIVDTVKLAEDEDALIVRLYEAHGASCRAVLTVPQGVSAAAAVDLLEENEQALALVDGTVALAFRAFEVKTVKLKK
jgi:alpha-mannosidase